MLRHISKINKRADRRVSKSARSATFEGRSFSRRLTLLRKRQIAQIRKTSVLEFVSQHERHATRARARASPLPNRPASGQTHKGLLYRSFSLFFFSLLSRKACRGSNRPRECLRALARIAARRATSRRAEPSRAEPSCAASRRAALGLRFQGARYAHASYLLLYQGCVRDARSYGMSRL